MKHLMNTLFVTSDDIYLSLEGENIIAKKDGVVAARYPLHTIEQVFSFSYAGASPALLGACTERNIGFAFCTVNGRFLARIAGISNGNVLLRREQYRVADDDYRSCASVRPMIMGKIYNARASIERTRRDHALKVDTEKLNNASEKLAYILMQVKDVTDLDSLRGLEGAAATVYFSCFNDLILRDKETFCFNGRNRRPPLDNVNAMLSFAYTLLANDCASGLESVGLDSYVGFLHKDRPGRKSLALDLMEELRPCFADRFVLTVINNRVLKKEDFFKEENGRVQMKDTARKKVIQYWQERKRNVITHPFLKEKIMWGLVPYVQSLLIARYIRGDLDQYPPFFWK